MMQVFHEIFLGGILQLIIIFIASLKDVVTRKNRQLIDHRLLVADVFFIRTANELNGPFLDL